MRIRVGSSGEVMAGVHFVSVNVGEYIYVWNPHASCACESPAGGGGQQRAGGFHGLWVGGRSRPSAAFLRPGALELWPAADRGLTAASARQPCAASRCICRPASQPWLLKCTHGGTWLVLGSGRRCVLLLHWAAFPAVLQLCGCHSCPTVSPRPGYPAMGAPELCCACMRYPTCAC